jgi:nicotinamide-nucleotide amidase
MTEQAAPSAPRAGILITGTEVLTGIISDRNGPWLSERLRELGVDAAVIQIVGDRPQDLLAALEFMRDEGLALIVTSGGLGPTADDLTAEVVGRFSGPEMVLDPGLEERIGEILRPMMERWPNLDADAIRRSNRKQAVIPEGAAILDPVGTAPGLVVAPREGDRPTVVVLPGPPRELQPMWETARRTEAFAAAIEGAVSYRREIGRLLGKSRDRQHTARCQAGLDPRRWITTCLRGGDRDRHPVRAAGQPPLACAALHPRAPRRHPVPEDGPPSDEQLRRCSRATPAVAESCTGGASLPASPTARARRPTSWAVWSTNEAKIDRRVDPGLIEAFGAVSPAVGRWPRHRGAFDAELGPGSRDRGPGGGTEDAGRDRLLSV